MLYKYAKIKYNCWLAKSLLSFKDENLGWANVGTFSYLIILGGDLID
jgi:hypothetical protein